MRILNTAKPITNKLGISSLPITLPSDPTLPMHAATKQYVDNQVSAVDSLARSKVSKSGDTITGPLVLQYTPTQPTHAITKQYADNLVATTAVSGISLTGPGALYPDQQGTYTITNFDSFSVYTVSVSAGTATRSNESITVTAPSSGTGFTLTISKDGKQAVYSIGLNPASVATPSITSPTNNAVDVALKPTFTSSAFQAYGGNQTHIASEWQIATDSNFTTIVQQSGESSTALTSWTPTSDLNHNTNYYIRVRHKGDATGWSSWSGVVSFKTVDMLGWVATLGGSGDDRFYSSSVSVEGNSTYVYAVGYEASSGGADNALIAKWDSQGNLIWQKKLGGSGNDYFSSSSVSVEGGSTYVYAVGYELSSGSGYYEALIAKWDSQGNLIWQKKLGGSSNDSFYSSSVSVEGDSTYVYAVGYERTSSGSNYYDALIAKWDSQGNLIWQKKLGGSSNNHFLSSSVSVEDGSTYVYAVGYELYSGNNNEALIAKWDSQGNLKWQKKLGGFGQDYFYSSSVSVEGGSTYVYAVGYEGSSGGADNALIAKWGSQGNLIWQKKLGGSGYDFFYSSSVSVEDGSTYVYAVGREGSSGSNSEALIAKWDSQGNLIWQKELVGSVKDYFFSSSVSVEGGSMYLYAVGYELSSGSKSEALISKWNASGQITQGTLAGIPQLYLADGNLSVGNPALNVGNPALTVGDPALTVGDPGLAVGNPNLTRVYSAY